MKTLSGVLILALLLQVEVASSKSKLQVDLERSSSYKEALSFKDAVKKGKLRDRANKSVDFMVKVAYVELKKKGNGPSIYAENLKQEYESKYRDIFLDDRKIGDHEGVAWLLKVHAEIEFILTEPICRALRLHDLWVLAETIPVVFSCEDKVDQIEYLEHFVAFSGVVSYWVTLIACSAGTMGMGGVSFLCGFAGYGVELLVERFIAPPLSPSLWKKVCHQ